MMIRKITVAACFAALLAMVSAPASAAAYFIGGTWYFFSLDFEAELGKVTGKDLKDLTNVVANVTITESNIQCANPNGNLVNPGKGPKVVASTSSSPLTGENFERADRKKGNIYLKTASVALPSDPPLGVNPCKDPAGTAEWLPTYWRYQNCNRGADLSYSVACYSERAVKIGGDLFFTTGGRVTDPLNWTFVYLPTVFTYVASVQTGGVPDPSSDPTLTGTCRLPFSLSNPPPNGWGASKVDYDCDGLPVPD